MGEGDVKQKPKTMLDELGEHIRGKPEKETENEETEEEKE